MKKQNNKKELIETIEWLLNNLNQNTLGKIEVEHGVGTVVDGHLYKMQLKNALKKAKAV